MRFVKAGEIDMVLNKKAIDREIYTYNTLLKQLSAKYDTSELKSLIKQLDSLYDSICQDENSEYNESIVNKLSIIVINLKIQIIHYGYADLKPVCQYLAKLKKKKKSNFFNLN